MLLLVDQVKKRTQFLNTYIDSVSQSIKKRRYNETLNFISQQRSAINHTNVTKYNPNTFIIDSLKTKNQNLTQIKKQLLKQKQFLQQKLDQCQKNSSRIKQHLYDSNVMTVLSKIQITLKDIKKIQYQPMQIESDYEKLTITNVQGKQTNIQLTNIKQIQRKSLYLLLHCQELKEKQQTKMYVMLKFSDQGHILKFHNVIVFGKMVQQAKSKRYLFLASQNYKISQKKDFQNNVERKQNLKDQSQVMPYSGQIPTLGNSFVPTKESSHLKAFNTSSLVREKDVPFGFDNNIQSFSNYPQQQLQKHMTHSLLVTLSQNLTIKRQLNNYSTFRPTPLNRVRGKSMYLQIEKGKNYQQFKRQPYNNYDEEKGDFFDNRSQRQQKSSHKSNFRKASQDITLRPKNITSQQRKLQKFRSQRNLVDEILIQSTQVRQPKKPNSIDRNYHSTLVSNNSLGFGSISGNSRRIQKQIEKKNQFLQSVNMNFYNNNNLHNSNKKSQNQHQTNRKQLQTTARWFNQEDIKSQSINSQKSNKKSQFSQNNNNGFPKKILYNKQNKQLFEQELQYSLQDQPEDNYQHNNSKINNIFMQNIDKDEIIEASQSNQISPTFPKKIVYEDGSHIRLYPVENTQSYHNHHESNHHEPSEDTIKNRKNSSNKKSKKHNENEQNDNVFIEPLEEMEQNELDESRHGFRNDRLNTLDSQTDKDQHNTNQINESNSQDHEEEQFQQLIDQLKKGLILTKCSQGSFWTRQKEVKLSENQNTLLVIDVKDKKIKKIPISDIDTIQYGKFSKGIIKHVPQIQERKCLIINAKQVKIVKKNQFVGNNPEKLSLFAQNLAYFVEMFKAS